ncbi:unnamed protein product [Peronospora effusa]|nr:unnamed protein product [Peronospora effusa]
MRTWVEFVKICKSDLNERKMVVMSTLYHYIKKPPNVQVAGMQIDNTKIDESRMIQLSTKADFLKDPSTLNVHNWL